MILKKTADGSYTLYRPDIDEHYHSFHGARQESEHVFIHSGLKHKLEAKPSELNILEIGYGTGYNALLSLLNNQTSCYINYTGLELYPVPTPLIQELSEKDEFIHQHKAIYLKMMNAAWDQSVEITEHFAISKLEVDFFKYETPQQFNLIYYDAFGFRAQEEMWQEKLYAKTFNLAKPGANLVTYAAKGVIRRGLEAAGWKVERLPGPPGKREMLRAQKPKE
ncbi:tRNA (5-methylaminomethyl-2-thiouridine)(34)-methyltransferase MnmD [Luteibaculum oceani]|uniref:tRNA (5-methylaminomethyl-2-thiouridine)(34)-methyltransferase MnmD n=1 Tax=Luteibaculum oceani TaxID=1294296 RepID=UPI001476D727|nr:tRNA (5-methylaminomethyl-2-thiouridine)(34)-methyltransferase MnmD [Luteibaculum oceani]